MLLRKMLSHPSSLFLFFVPIPLSFFSRFMQINAFQSKSKCERSSLKKKTNKCHKQNLICQLLALVPQLPDHILIKQVFYQSVAQKMPVTDRAHGHELDAPRKVSEDEVPTFAGGWRGIPKFVIDRRFVSVSVETRVLRRLPAHQRLTAEPEHGGLFVTFSYHHHSSRTSSRPAAVSLRGGLRPLRFVLSTSADDDHPQFVTACQRSLAIASVLYDGCAAALLVDTVKCGILTWEAQRDGCFGTCSIARSVLCGSSTSRESGDTGESGGVVQAVALLNANLVLPATPCHDLSLPPPPPLLVLYCTDGEQGALDRQERSGKGGWVRDSTNRAVVDALSLHSFSSRNYQQMQRSTRACVGVPAYDTDTDLSQFLLPGGPTCGLLLPLQGLSSAASSQLSHALTGIQNIVVLVNVEQRPTSLWDDTHLNQTIVEAVRGALGRLAADNMDVFGRCSRDQVLSSGGSLSIEDAGRIQCIADAVVSMITTSRHHYNGEGATSPFEEKIHMMLAIPHESRPRPSDAPLTAATLRYFVEESLRRQYTTGCGPR
jgi:hypothetical protein